MCFYRVFGQLDIIRRRSLHDVERSAQIAPTPVEGHSFEDRVYPFQHLHLAWMQTEREVSARDAGPAEPKLRGKKIPTEEGVAEQLSAQSHRVVLCQATDEQRRPQSLLLHHLNRREGSISVYWFCAAASFNQ